MDESLNKKTNFFKEFFRAKQVKIYLALLIFLNACSWTFCYLFLKKLNQEMVVLHYNVDLGVDLFEKAYKILVIPAFGLAIIILNSLFALFSAGRKNFRFISHLFLAAALLANIFLLLSLGPIYLINFR